MSYIKASGASLGSKPRKWMSDGGITNIVHSGSPSDLDLINLAAQAREANRLREDNERLMAIAQAESEGHSKLREGLEALISQWESDIVDGRIDPQDKAMCKEKLQKLLENG